MSAKERLEEIKNEMKALLEEATQLIRTEVRMERSNKIVWERAKAYWVGHIALALDNESDYVGRNHTMADTVNELEDESEEDESDEADE